MIGPRRLCVVFFFSLLKLAVAEHGATRSSTMPFMVPGNTALTRGLQSSTESIPEGRIRLDVMVTDAAGKPVSGLELQDFTLLDDGHPQKIASFLPFNGSTTNPDTPVQIILVIDFVNLPFQELSFVREEVAKFLRHGGGHLKQPVAIYLLSNAGSRVLSQPSKDGNVLAQTLDQLKGSIHTITSAMVPEGWDKRFQLSVRGLQTIVADEARKPGRKLLIWIGAGWPLVNPELGYYSERDQQGNFATIVELSTRLREARIALYSVTPSIVDGGDSMQMFLYKDYLKGVNSPRQAGTGNLGLNVLATQSGGRILGPDNDLAGQINRCVAEANVFYQISFNPPTAKRTDEYHDLKVLTDRVGLTAHANTGYYDQLEYSRPDSGPSFVGVRAPSDSGENHDPSIAAKQISVEQLEQALKEAHSRPDAEVAEELSGLELTQRLGSTILASWQAGLPGVRSRATLAALADASVFLALPPAQNPATPPPELAEQRRMIAATFNYLKETIPKLPNFSVTRTTVRFERTLQYPSGTGVVVVGKPWRSAGGSATSLVYRGGREEVDPVTATGKRSISEEKGLITRGTFGPILSTVILDAAHSQMNWSHWEVAAAGPDAVFRFVVPVDKSHYAVAFRGLRGDDESDALQQPTAYHGEIAIDPATGTILRLTVVADREPSLPIVRGDIMVEYGPVEIGGKTYICPVRSVSVAVGRSAIVEQKQIKGSSTPGAETILLNDVGFGNYHVFRSESRILP
jgi:VWFA-related protein